MQPLLDIGSRVRFAKHTYEITCLLNRQFYDYDYIARSIQWGHEVYLLDTDVTELPRA